eukprot:12430011-Karenia_brevis.AAC.1
MSATAITPMKFKIPDPPNKVVRNVSESFKWFDHAMTVAVDHTEVSVNDCCKLLSNRKLSTSAAFAGIGAPENSCHAITCCSNAFLNQHGRSGTMSKPVKFTNSWMIEWDKKCIAEIKALPDPPDHVLTNILLILPFEVQKMCGLHGGKELSARSLRRIVPW